MPHGGSTDVRADLTPGGDEEPRRGKMLEQLQKTTFFVQVRQDDDQGCQEEQTKHHIGLPPPTPPPARHLGLLCVSMAQGPCPLHCAGEPTQGMHQAILCPSCHHLSGAVTQSAQPFQILFDLVGQVHASGAGVRRQYRGIEEIIRLGSQR